MHDHDTICFQNRISRSGESLCCNLGDAVSANTHHLELLSKTENLCAGYGNSAPNDCYLGSFLITVQTIVGLFLDSITLGIIFARISHPKNRGRTIGISDSAVISRRDGILKFMFRIADFRDTQARATLQLSHVEHCCL